MAYGGAYIPNAGAEKALAIGAYNASPPTAKATDPNLGKPTSAWMRLAKEGAGMVANFAKGVVVSTAQGAKGAVTGVARMLPGGQNDLKAQAQQATSADESTKQILALQKSGRISKPQATKMLIQVSKNASGASSSVAKTLRSQPTTKEFAGDLAQTALLVAPGLGGGAKAAESGGATLLREFGQRGVAELAAKAGVDISEKSAQDAAEQVAKTAVGKSAVRTLTKGSAGVRALKSAGKGAAGFGSYSAASTAGEGGSNKQILKSGFEGAATGSLLGGGASLLKSAVSKKVDLGAVRQAAKEDQVEKISKAVPVARQTGADDAKVKEILTKGVGSNRADTTRLIEKNQANLSAEDRLKLTGGDTGQAGLQMSKVDRDAMLAKFRAQAKGKGLGESGSVAPGQAAGDIQDMIAKHQETTKYSGDIQRGGDEVEGAKKQIASDAVKVAKATPKLSALDKKTLQDYRDAKEAGLPTAELPARLQKANDDITALNRAAIAAKREQATLEGRAYTDNINPETYVHREAQGKNTVLDQIASGAKRGVQGGTSFGKRIGSDKARVFHAITDETGKRRIVSIANSQLKSETGKVLSRGKLVTALDEGGAKSQLLGKLKLQSKEDLLEKEVKPYQKKIASLQKEYDTLKTVRAKGGPSEARIRNLAQKVALLEDTGNFTSLTRSEARSLRIATLKLKELVNVKPSDTNVGGKLVTISRKLIDLHNQANEIYNKYNPDELNDRVFVGNDGERYTIGQATTSEITKASGQRYYVDPQLTSLKNYVDSRTALENVKFIESIKNHPDFENFASPPDKVAPASWESVKGLMQFPGYKFEPKTAEALRDIVKNSSDEASLLDKAGKFLKQTIVYFPLKHNFNQTATYAVDRGLSSLVNPMAYKRGAVSLVKAFNEVTNQGPLFQKLQKSGFELASGDEKAFNKYVTDELHGLTQEDPHIQDVAKSFGTTPARLYSAIQHTAVWEYGDILNVARVIERMQPTMLRDGMSFEDAMKQTERYSLQYKVPSRVGPSKLGRSLSRTFQSPKVFFGRYRYDLYKILGNTIKDTTNLSSLAHGGRQNFEAVDKLAAMAFGAAMVWPLVDKGLQKLSGDPNANMSAPGALQLPELINKVRTGQKTPEAALGQQVYPSPVITLPLEVQANRDSFTGKEIYDPNAPTAEKAQQVASWLKGQSSFGQKSESLNNVNTNKALGVLLSLAGTNLPKNGPAMDKLYSLQFDSLPDVQAKAKAQAKQGDIGGAQATISDYDRQVLSAARNAYRSQGKTPPPDDVLITELKKSGTYYSPKQSTIQAWQYKTPTNAKSTLGL